MRQSGVLIEEWAGPSHISLILCDLSPLGCLQRGQSGDLGNHPRQSMYAETLPAKEGTQLAYETAATIRKNT